MIAERLGNIEQLSVVGFVIFFTLFVLGMILMAVCTCSSWEKRVPSAPVWVGLKKTVELTGSVLFVLVDLPVLISLFCMLFLPPLGLVLFYLYIHLFDLLVRVVAVYGFGCQIA